MRTDESTLLSNKRLPRAQAMKSETIDTALSKIKCLSDFHNPKFVETSKYHKTRFKIKKREEPRAEAFERVLCDFINQNKYLKNNTEKPLSNLPKNILPVESVKFVDEILPQKNLLKNKYGFDEDNLKKNHLMLEQYILKRMIMKNLQKKFA
eukprot:TRINITY_DN3456_c0_g1_i3.p2 TRINITY_DN3456_c0_g1~~TRINITY_DN3456_c0_g1_i3.p2  ORF type:complete len:152 (-),score=27.83 TRINITY_DN3456_c0_g1_i3:194-649(-)